MYAEFASIAAVTHAKWDYFSGRASTLTWVSSFGLLIQNMQERNALTVLSVFLCK